MDAENCSYWTHGSPVCLEHIALVVSVFFVLQRRAGQEEVEAPGVRHCSLAPSVAAAIFSVFLDFRCICSCSFLLSFSLCFSIFSWAFRAFSRDTFISFSFFLTTARSWDDVIPRAWEGNTHTNHLKTDDPLFMMRLVSQDSPNSGTDINIIQEVENEEERSTFAKGLRTAGLSFTCSFALWSPEHSTV